MVTVLQRFDSALRLNVQFHTLVLDGVYVKHADGQGLGFLRLSEPKDKDVHEVAFRTAKRVAGILDKIGFTLEGASMDEEARQAIREAQDDLFRRTALIPSSEPEVRRAFVENIPDHRRTLELAQEWLGDDELQRIEPSAQRYCPRFGRNIYDVSCTR